jgi:preprotein translocase subunit SecD
MKTVIKTIIAGLILISSQSFNRSAAQVSNELLLQAVDTNIASEELEQSALVMKKRLEAFGIEPRLLVDEKKNTINVILPYNADKSELSQLLIRRCSIGFYETLSLHDITEFMQRRDPGVTVDLKTAADGCGIGCSTSKDSVVHRKMQTILRQLELSGNTGLFWSKPDNKSQICLYVLKTWGNGNPPLSETDLESVTVRKEQNGRNYSIRMKFKPGSASIFEDLTIRNIGKTIAIVIDDEVIYDPVVKAPMTGGLCEITGNFSEKEVKFLQALLNNGQLPVDFNIMN